LGILFRFPAPKKVAAAPVAEPVMVAVVMDEIAPYDDEALPPLQEQEAAPPCKPATETITIQAETLFGFDKHDLKAEGKAILDEQVVAKMKVHPDFEFVLITGHTDLIGTDAYNQKLSERRANQVKNYLVSQGVDASRLKAVGKGEAEPVVDCKGVRGKKLIECLAPNRRVVLDATHTQEVGCE
jgi:OOP family OmpA-OmpF porin